MPNAQAGELNRTAVGRAPRPRRGHRMGIVCATAAACVLLAIAPSGSVKAEHEHTVAPGQTLSRIAARYDVPVSTLLAANGLTRASQLRAGQSLRVPPRGVVYVRKGDTLAAIARRYDVPRAELSRRNQLSADAPLRIGQRLLLPGYEAARVVEAAEKRWGAPKRRGVATFHRVATSTTERIRLLDHRGRLRGPAVRELATLLKPRRSRRGKEPHPRLVRLLARISDHFGGRPLHVISGLRTPGGYTRTTSRHVAGHAIDFRIPGVPLEVLREYCAKLSHVGVGYYPRSKFVHLDVRRTNARWTDLSGPGEAPMLARGKLADARAASGRTGLALAGEESEPAAADDGQPPIEGPADRPVED